MAEILRYCDPNAAAGGNGTTNALSGGNCAYVSLNAWEAATQQDLVTGSNTARVVCSSDDAGSTHAADTTSVSIDGWTTNATCHIAIEAASSHGGKWNNSIYRLNSNYFQIVEGNVRVSGLLIGNNGAAGAYLFHCQPGAEVCDYQFYNVIVINSAASGQFGSIGIEGTPSASSSVKINNCIGITGNTSTGRNARFNHANWVGYIENCNIIGAGYGAGCAMTAGTWHVKNTYSGNHASGSDYATGGTIDYTTCASSDSTNRGAGVTASIAYSTSSGAYFTNVTAGSEDLHIGVSSSLKDVGTDLSADAGWIADGPIDIDGVARTGTWDIGADEYVAAGGGPVIPVFMHHYLHNMGR